MISVALSDCDPDKNAIDQNVNKINSSSHFIFKLQDCSPRSEGSAETGYALMFDQKMSRILIAPVES